MTAIVPLLACLLTNHQTMDWPVTRAERSGYVETSTYADVITFVEQLQVKGAPFTLKYIGKSESGKRIPLCIFSSDGIQTEGEARQKGKLVAYIQANIHAGEVEGKEAALAVMRELSQGKHPSILNNMVLLFCPIYNIDGNDKMAENRRNRPSQDGPAMVGERASGQGFDLNRDCIKAESHEMRAVLEHVYAKWNPDLIMDLHTTNGTRHGFPMTYSPPMSPNTNAGVMKFTRDEMLPKLRSTFLKDGLAMFDYGDVDKRGDIRGWYTFGSEGRYVSNYAGLRNRISVLTEAASFRPFKVRVEATHKLVLGVLQYVSKNAKRVSELIAKADKETCQSGQELGVRFEIAKGRDDTVILEKVKSDSQINHMKEPTEWTTEKLPIFDRFRATKTATFPTAYFIPAAESATVELLRRHGIRVEQFVKPWAGQGSEFVISELSAASNPFQGHNLVRLEGNHRPTTISATNSDFIVRTHQPLGILAFHILEAEGLDGAAAWNFCDPRLSVGGVFPIRKLKEVNGVVTELIP